MSNGHQMYIKGMREPITIPKSVAETIGKLIANPATDSKTPVDIEGVWTGTRADIKFIKFPPVDAYENEGGSSYVEAMTDIVAEAFEVEILPYQMEAEATGFGTFNWPKFYMHSKDIIRLDVYITDSNRRYLHETVTNPLEYPKMQKHIQSYVTWKGKKEYAEKKELIRLEQMALEEDYKEVLS